MIETTVQLFCDGCETAYPADSRVTGGAAMIRQAARADGWSTTGRGANLSDRCKACGLPAQASASRSAGNAVAKLSPTQIELLTDLVTHPQMYIDRYRAWHRTADALISRGLAFIVADHLHHNPYELRITEKGKATAADLGLTVTGSSPTGGES